MRNINTTIAEVYTNYVNGNRTDAAKQIRGLTKIGIVRMMTEYYNFNGAGIDIVSNPETKYNFELFIMRALEGQV
jgi:hypothetical protein